MRRAAGLIVRFAACAASSWLAWRQFGPAMLAITAPLWAIAFARPLLDLAGGARHLLRAAVWQPLEGRHVAYRGRPVQVLEDERHRRWVRAADVRAIVGTTTSDSALALTYPDGWRSFGRPAEPHFDEDALLLHLARLRTPEATRLGFWAERQIVFPARRVRERLGIRPNAEPVTAPPGPVAAAGEGASTDKP